MLKFEHFVCLLQSHFLESVQFELIFELNLTTWYAYNDIHITRIFINFSWEGICDTHSKLLIDIKFGR